MDSEWKNITKGQKIPVDLQKQQLLVKTNSTVGSTDRITIFFYESEYRQAGGVSVSFYSPIEYWIFYCNASFYKFPVTPLIAAEDTWAFSRTKTGIKIECNGKIVLETDVSPSNCDDSNSDLWSREVKKVEFYDSDSASLQYRLDPPGLNLETGLLFYSLVLYLNYHFENLVRA